jgi:hypothetical protein
VGINIFKNIKEIEEEEFSPKFKFLRDNEMLKNEKEILKKWVEEFIDRDGKIIKEFQTTFHSSFWEFYLFNLFKEVGFNIDLSKKRPDFMIKEPYEINVEAVVSNIKQNGKSEKERKFEDTLSMLMPPRLKENYDVFISEAITRQSNSIHQKNNKFLEDYSNCDWVSLDTPFVIALGSYDQINYGREFFYSMIALLYGLYYVPKTDDYIRKKYIIKPGTNSKIDIGLFSNSSFENISAIIFSCTVTLGKLTSLSISKGNPSLNGVINIRLDQEYPKYKIQLVKEETPEELSDGVFIFYNPNAKTKLPMDAFKKTNVVHVTYKNEELMIKSEHLPLIARYNTSKLFLNKDFIIEIGLRYNSLNI